MISIAEAISDLMFVRDMVVVPGLGAFLKKPVSAKVNPVANYFSMPNSVIEFDANLREDNDLVVRYLSEKNEISEEEARKQLAIFVSDSFSALKNKKKVELKGIGTLSYDGADDLCFEQDKTVNYNSDAFGLADFSPTPVLRPKTKDEIKLEIEKLQRYKNTPVTVDEKAVHQYDQHKSDDEESHHHGWLWALLALLLIGGALFGLHYFKVVDLRFWKQEPQRVINPDDQNRIYSIPTYVWDWQKQQGQNVNKSIEQQKDAIVEEPALTTSEATIRIIAGCYDQEENAARFANVLKEKGYQEAFYELRGTKWFVSFGRYATEEEAVAVLREIRANTEYKAWILK